MKIVVVFALLSLISSVRNVTIDYRIRKVDAQGVYSHSFGPQRCPTLMDCVVESVSSQNTIGIRKNGKCYYLSRLQRSDYDENIYYSKSFTIILEKIGEEICPFEPITTFFHPIHKLKSVYYVTKKVYASQARIACKNEKGGRPAIITSRQEMVVLLKVQQKIGEPLLTAAKAKAGVWKWMTSIFDMPIWVWKNTWAPIPMDGFYGAINNSEYLVPFHRRDGGIRVLCECHEYRDL